MYIKANITNKYGTIIYKYNQLQQWWSSGQQNLPSIPETRVQIPKKPGMAHFQNSRKSTNVQGHLKLSM